MSLFLILRNKNRKTRFHVYGHSNGRHQNRITEDFGLLYILVIYLCSFIDKEKFEPLNGPNSHNDKFN